MCVITIKLNTLTDVPYRMTVGGAFVYVCENLLTDFEQQSRVYNVACYNAGGFPVDPDNRVIMESQCTRKSLLFVNHFCHGFHGLNK